MPQQFNKPLQKLSQGQVPTKPMSEEEKQEVRNPQMISLVYTFIFAKEANLWDKLDDFETDLSDFFSANGLEAELIATIEGSTGGRMMMLNRAEIDQKLSNSKGANIQMLPKQQNAQKSVTMIKNMVGSLKGAK